MARNQSKRLPPGKIEADESGLAALQTITDYTPINSTYTVNAVKASHDELQSLRCAEVQAQAALASAREHAVAKEWEFHNLMLGVKEQVIAQFGKDSDEVQAIGLKRKSEYKPPKRRSSSNGETP
jgi:hypothetical protein